MWLSLVGGLLFPMTIVILLLAPRSRRAFEQVSARRTRAQSSSRLIALGNLGGGIAGALRGGDVAILSSPLFWILSLGLPVCRFVSLVHPASWPHMRAFQSAGAGGGTRTHMPLRAMVFETIL